MGISNDSILLFGWSISYDELIEWYEKKYNADFNADFGSCYDEVDELWEFSRDDFCFKIIPSRTYCDCGIIDMDFYLGIYFKKTIDIPDMKKLINIPEKGWYEELLEHVKIFGGHGPIKMITAPKY
jgi:hypothetical protein